jgi:hypothetical protein
MALEGGLCEWARLERKTVAVVCGTNILGAIVYAGARVSCIGPEVRALENQTRNPAGHLLQSGV